MILYNQLQSSEGYVDSAPYIPWIFYILSISEFFIIKAHVKSNSIVPFRFFSQIKIIRMIICWTLIINFFAQNIFAFPQFLCFCRVNIRLYFSIINVINMSRWHLLITYSRVGNESWGSDVPSPPGSLGVAPIGVWK